MASPSYLIGCTLCLNGFQSKWLLACCYYDAKALLSKKGWRVLFVPGVNGKIFPAAQPVCPWPALGLWEDPWWEQGMEGPECLTQPDFVCLVFLSGEENSTELWFSQGINLLWPVGRSLQAADRRKLLQAPSQGRLWPHSLDYAGSCSLFHILHQSPGHISFPFLISKGFPQHLARSLLIIPPGDLTSLHPRAEVQGPKIGTNVSIGLWCNSLDRRSWEAATCSFSGEGGNGVGIR